MPMLQASRYLPVVCQYFALLFLIYFFIWHQSLTSRLGPVALTSVMTASAVLPFAVSASEAVRPRVAILLAFMSGCILTSG